MRSGSIDIRAADGVAGPRAEDRRDDQQRQARAGAAADEHVRRDVEQPDDGRRGYGAGPDHAGGARGSDPTPAEAAIAVVEHRRLAGRGGPHRRVGLDDPARVGTGARFAPDRRRHERAAMADANLGAEAVGIVGRRLARDESDVIELDRRRLEVLRGARA